MGELFVTVRMSLADAEMLARRDGLADHESEDLVEAARVAVAEYKALQRKVVAEDIAVILQDTLGVSYEDALEIGGKLHDKGLCAKMSG